MLKDDSKKLSERVEILENNLAKMKKYYDECLESLDEGNFSEEFLRKITGKAGDAE